MTRETRRSTAAATAAAAAAPLATRDRSTSTSIKIEQQQEVSRNSKFRPSKGPPSLHYHYRGTEVVPLASNRSTGQSGNCGVAGGRGASRPRAAKRPKRNHPISADEGTLTIATSAQGLGERDDNRRRYASSSSATRIVHEMDSVSVATLHYASKDQRKSCKLRHVSSTCTSPALSDVDSSTSINGALFLQEIDPHSGTTLEEGPQSETRSSSAHSSFSEQKFKNDEPEDRFTRLSAELIGLILYHVSPPSPETDLKSLYNLCLVNRALLPHVRLHMYRELKIDTRVHAHALHRTLHGNEINTSVKNIVADVGTMAKTSSQWLGWFLFHSMHSLCGIIGSCRSLLNLSLYLPSDASAWTQSLCTSLIDLKLLQTLTKDMEPSNSISDEIPSAATRGPGGGGFDPIVFGLGGGGGGGGGGPGAGIVVGGATGVSATNTVLGRRSTNDLISGAGRKDGMDVGWRPRRSVAMWSVSQFIKPLATLKSLHTLRLCGISSDSSTSPPQQVHSCKLVEVVLIEVNITNTDLLHILGHAQHLKKLTLWRSSLLSKRGLTHVLKRCPNLVELKIGGSWFGAKDEQDTNFPLDIAIAYLPHLRIIHVSGNLISPSILLQPSTRLSHLLVVGASSFTPQSIHSALAKMRGDPDTAVHRLTLPEMGWRLGAGEQWTDTWKFTVRATAHAKGVTLEDAYANTSEVNHGVVSGQEDESGSD